MLLPYWARKTRQDVGFEGGSHDLGRLAAKDVALIQITQVELCLAACRTVVYEDMREMRLNCRGFNMVRKGAKIGATAGIILAGLAAGPVAALLMLTRLESSGALDSEWAFGYIAHILLAFVIAGIVGGGVAAYSVYKIWR